MKHRREVLDNGLRIITVPMPSIESATVLVMVGAGSRYEGKENNGLSHFLEHMAFKGTKKRSTPRDIATEIDNMGGQNNAFTSKEVTGFYVKSAADQIDKSIEILSDMIKNSQFPEEEIEKERGVIIEEIKMYEDTPMRNLPDVYERLVYGDTPLGWDTIGLAEVIRRVKRADFIDYMSKLYSPSNMTVIVAGGIDSDKTVEKIKEHFGKMIPFATLKPNKVVVLQNKPRASVKKKDTEQVHLALGVTTSSLKSPDRYPLSVIGSLLGAGMSSRLFSEVREKRGLAYYVRAYSHHYTDHGSLTTFSGLNRQKVGEAIKVIIEEYRKIRDEADKIDEKELKKGKQIIKGNLALELEDSRAVAMFFGEQELLEEKIETPNEVIENVEKVTIADIAKVADKYIRAERLNLAMIGNFESTEEFEKELKL